MTAQIDHVAIAVHSIDAAFAFFSTLFEIDPATIQRWDRTADLGFFSIEFQLGESKIELLEPRSDHDLVARFLERRGQGVHHLTFAVDNLDETIASLAEGQVPVFGTGYIPEQRWYETYIHPRDAQGVLIQLSEQDSNGPGNSG